jgi:putative transposase
VGAVSRAVLRIGDRVRFDGRVHAVVGLAGTMVRLADEYGVTSVVALAHLLAAPGFEQIGGRGVAPVLPAGLLEGLPAEAVAEALWWQSHIIEVITGRHPETPEVVRPEFDPAVTVLADRERAKAAELAVLGRSGVTARTVKRKRQRYEARGLAGLVDWRVDRRRTVAGRTDPRVLEALAQAIDEATSRSTRTAAHLHWRVGQILMDRYGDGVVVLPARATFYRLFARLGEGRHTTGSARTRRSLANRPDGPFGAMTAGRPGELMEIDSTPLDVLVLLENGVIDRVELTGMVDLATRSITAAVLRPTTKSVDASLLLARTVTPEPMQPGWADALAMSRSVLPHRRMLELDSRLAHAAARPVILPETIVCDRGKVFVSDNFRTACAALGITLQPAHPDTPTDKPHIERTLGSVSTMFCQYVTGYVGRSAEHRGKKVEADRLWSMLELQNLLDEWIVAVWQNRPHDGLRDPVTPGRAYSPNEKYAALVETAGYIPVALGAEDYIELLPARWQAINAYGIKVNHRTYDSPDLNGLRRQPSGVTARKNLWEVHHDPYDVSRVWVRNHHASGWVTAFWKHLASVPTPFGDLAWNHARAQHPDGRAADEGQLAVAVAELLTRADAGPSQPATAVSKRDRRVAARTRATTIGRPTEPMPAPSDEEPMDSDDMPLAPVIPLPVFDPFAEARKRR